MDQSLIELSIIICSWNTRDLLRNCLNSIYRTAHKATFEVFVIENASSDGSAAMVEKEFPRVFLIKNNSNIGHAAANNQGIEKSRGAFILLLNSDLLVLEGCIDTMVSMMEENSSIDVLSGQSLNPDGTIQMCCRRFPILKTVLFDDTFLGWRLPNNAVMARYRYRDWLHNDFRQVEQPPITCFMIRRKIIDIVGLFDDKFFLYFNDVDWCYRITKANFKIWFTPQAQVIHYGSVSIYKNKSSDVYYQWQKGRMRYYRKHFGWYAECYIKCILWLDFLERLTKLLLKRFLNKIDRASFLEQMNRFFRVVTH